jgi:DNA repair photolyase
MKTRQAAQVLGRLGGSKTSPEKAAAAKINGTQGGRPIKATVNPDGVSIAGCSTIYAPRGQAGEYAPLATNPYRGCGHGCAYCYVPQVLRMDRVEFNAGAFPRPNFLNSLNADARKYQAAGITEQVMLSFTTDPYHPGDHSLTHATITTLRDHGLAFCTLTKGGTRALRDLAYFRPDRDAFASTLTSLDDKFSQKWEPKAALPSDRLEALRRFHNAGIFTWVSLEPTLDVESSLAIVRETHEFVDLFKIGQVNYLPMTKTTNWHEYTDRMVELCQKLGVKHYIKKDLQPFLPDGYVNIRRMTQHH